MATYNRVHDLLNGFPTAPTGTAAFYSPGTTSPIVIYGDDTGTAITNPVTLDSNGAATVYLSSLARMVVQDVSGAIVVDTVINGDTDSTISTTSTAFTGATVKAALDAALAKFGGQDFQYVPSGSWAGMSPKTWMNGVGANVLAYVPAGGSPVNDGVTPADSALAAAIADAQAGGSKVVLLPAGTYLLNSPVAINTTGITLQGAGAGATTLKINSGTNDGLVFTSANGSAVRGMRITATAATTGKAINVSGVTGFVVDAVKTDGAAVGLYLNNTTYASVYGNSNLDGTLGLSGTTAIQTAIIGGVVTSLTTSGFSQLTMVGTQCVTFTADSGSGRIALVGCTITAIVFTGGAQPSHFYQYGNAIEGQTINCTTGATCTAPDLANGNEITLNANAGGAGTVTVPLPLNPPPNTRRGYVMTIKYKNALGGAAAVTWAFTGNWPRHIGGAPPGTVPPNTDAHTIIIQYLWDITVSAWREISRTDTTT